jgi:hypothetical protein
MILRVAEAGKLSAQPNNCCHVGDRTRPGGYMRGGGKRAWVQQNMEVWAVGGMLA